MRKSSNIILLTVGAMLTAGLVCRRTIQEQEKAGKEKRHVPNGPYEAVLKRPLDLLITGMALIPLTPVMGITAFLVKAHLGSPVYFKQVRPGKNGKLFTLYKFRTMTDETDQNGKRLPDEKRLTRFGRILRSTSMDELPELFNILKGDMSLVGPRPLLVEYLPRYNERQRHRHDVRPGLTGLAQVSGRNDLSWEEKFEWDLKYVERISFYEDCRIVWKTIQKVIQREGIHSKNSATMEDFKGNQ